jgi:hypothetical protein
MNAIEPGGKPREPKDLCAGTGSLRQFLLGLNTHEDELEICREVHPTSGSRGRKMMDPEVPVDVRWFYSIFKNPPKTK